jgi:hypothetical protein
MARLRQNTPSALPDGFAPATPAVAILAGGLNARAFEAAPLPEAPIPAATPVPAQALTVPTQNLPSIAPPASLATMMGGSALTAQNVQASSRAPYLYFHHDRANAAGDVRAVCPHVRQGQAFIVAEGAIVELPAGWSFTVGYATPYWANIDISDGSTHEIAWKDPGRGDPRKCNVLSVTIIDDGQTFHATCSTWRGPKTPAPLTHLQSLRTAMTPHWIDLAPNEQARVDRASIAAACGAFNILRLWSTLDMKSRKSASGFLYEQADARPRPAMLAQLARFRQWFDQGGAEALAAATEAYETRIEQLKASEGR